MLTEMAIKQAKPKDKTYRLADQRGLYLEVTPTGSKYWRYKYRIKTNGQRKEKRLSLGVYPEVGLKEVRDKHQAAHAFVAKGEDPSALKRQQQALEESLLSHTFGKIGADWFETQSPGWSATHRERQQRLFGKDLAPLHPLAIQTLKAPELLKVLRRIESRGHWKLPAERTRWRVRFSGMALRWVSVNTIPLLAWRRHSRSLKQGIMRP